MIYFIQDTKSRAIKIGISRDPVERLARLQVAHPSPLRLVALMDGSADDERALHQLFTRRGGEWFEPTRDLISYIRTRAVSIDAIKAVRSGYHVSVPQVADMGDPPNENEQAAVGKMIEHKASADKPTKASTIWAGFAVKKGESARYKRASEVYDALFTVQPEYPALAATRQPRWDAEQAT